MKSKEALYKFKYTRENRKMTVKLGLPHKGEKQWEKMKR